MDISKLKIVQTLKILSNYEGKNPYILNLKAELKRKGKINLTSTQEEYIKRNKDFEPYKIDRVIPITEYLGEELRKQYDLTFTPQRIYFGFIIGENDKVYHVYGKLKQKDNLTLLWIPKSQVMIDPYFEPIEVNIDLEPIIANDILDRTPFNYQRDGIEFLISRGKCILGDEQGTGKTYMSIMAAIASGAKKILVVCPASLKVNWKREINLLGVNNVSVVNGYRWSESMFTIVNYDILGNFHTIDGTEEGGIVKYANIINGGFDTLIVDEAHKVKNHTSNRGAIIRDLAVKAGFKRIWLLTGTPVANKPKDLYNLLKIIDHPIAKDWDFYTKRYCEAKNFKKKLKNGKIKTIRVIDGASNLDELNIKIKNHLIRRLKKNVLDLPDKIITPIHYELTESQLYEYETLWENYLIERAKNKKKGNPERDLVEIILLRRFISMCAIEHTIEIVDELVENGEKVIIFTTFNDEIKALYDHYGSSSVIHNGTMSDSDKQKSVDRFMNDPKAKVFIGNIISAGVGLTLTISNTVVFNSFDWVPGNNEQAEDRAHRISQKNCVNVYYHLFNDTIATRMWYTLKNKKKVISAILGDDTDQDEIIIDLIREDE